MATKTEQALSKLAGFHIDDIDTPPASGVTYTPGVGANWTNPDPTLVSEALDTLAARAVDVETSVIRLAVSVAAEAADVIKVTYTATHADGSPVTAAVTLRIGLHSSLVCDESTLEIPATFTLTDGGAGTRDASALGTSLHIFSTTAAGSLQVDVTDVGGASGATRHLYAAVIATTSPSGRACSPLRTSVIFD